MMKLRERHTFNDDFKQQMVALYQQGKTRNELVLEYDLTPSSLGWISQYGATRSFRTKDNRSTEENNRSAQRKQTVICPHFSGQLFSNYYHIIS